MDKAQKIERAIRINCDSMISHLPFTYGKNPEKKLLNKGLGGKDFHKKCVKEYAEVIKILSELL